MIGPFNALEATYEHTVSVRLVCCPLSRCRLSKTIRYSDNLAYDHSRRDIAGLYWCRLLFRFIRFHTFLLISEPAWSLERQRRILVGTVCKNLSRIPFCLRIVFAYRHLFCCAFRLIAFRSGYGSVPAYSHTVVDPGDCSAMEHSGMVIVCRSFFLCSVPVYFFTDTRLIQPALNVLCHRRLHVVPDWSVGWMVLRNNRCRVVQQHA